MPPRQRLHPPWHRPLPRRRPTTAMRRRCPARHRLPAMKQHPLPPAAVAWAPHPTPPARWSPQPASSATTSPALSPCRPARVRQALRSSARPRQAKSPATAAPNPYRGQRSLGRMVGTPGYYINVGLFAEEPNARKPRHGCSTRACRHSARRWRPPRAPASGYAWAHTPLPRKHVRRPPAYEACSSKRSSSGSNPKGAGSRARLPYSYDIGKNSVALIVAGMADAQAVGLKQENHEPCPPAAAACPPHAPPPGPLPRHGTSSPRTANGLPAAPRWHGTCARPGCNPATGCCCSCATTPLPGGAVRRLVGRPGGGAGERQAAPPEVEWIVENAQVRWGFTTSDVAPTCWPGWSGRSISNHRCRRAAGTRTRS